VLLVGAGAGCTGDSTTGPGNGDPEVASLRLTVGNQLVTIDRNGSVVGGPIVLRAGVTASVSAVFVQTSGLPDPRVTPAEYQLNLSSVIQPSCLVYEPSTTDPFAGTMRCDAPGATLAIRLSLHHVERQRDYWGPFNATVTVAQ
jgi:hypothetical protein